MSIRLRLTVLYSTILALTLIAFSTILYATQARLTYDSIKANLARQTEAVANGARHFSGSGQGGLASSNSSSSAPNLLPGRWTQIRKLDGTVVARSPDLGSTTLPLSAAGLRAVRSGSPWVETAQVDASGSQLDASGTPNAAGGAQTTEPVLIYSKPVLLGASIQIIQVASPIAERAQSLATLRWILLTGSSLVILAAFVIGWVLAGTALRPIHRITQTAQAIGAERDFSRRVAHTGPNDEIGQLATTFNTMLTELESGYRQVEEALHAQRRFVADASHELRTPLTTIRGNIELLCREPPMSANERADVLADVKDEVERLIRLVKQLLVLARADAGRPLHCEPVAIHPLIEDVYRETALLAPQRMVLCQTPPAATVLGDHDALKQVLLILVDNALVHTPAQATISIETEQKDHQVAISVRDSGSGIAPQALPHIFERFYRGSTSRTGGGTGLGLSIAQELVRGQQGTLTVESRVGQGSIFTVTLPLAA